MRGALAGLLWAALLAAQSQPAAPAPEELRRAVASFDAGRFDAAVDVLGHAVTATPADAELRYRYATCRARLARSPEDMEAALRQFETVVAYNPDFHEAEVEMARLLVRIGQNEDARSMLQRAQAGGYDVFAAVEEVPELQGLRDDAQFLLALLTVERPVFSVKERRDPFLVPLRPRERSSGEGGGWSGQIQEEYVTRAITLYSDLVAAMEARDGEAVVAAYGALDGHLGDRTRVTQTAQRQRLGRVVEAFETLKPAVSGVQQRLLRDEGVGILRAMRDRIQEVPLDVAAVQRLRDEDLQEFLGKLLASDLPGAEALAGQFREQGDTFLEHARVQEEFNSLDLTVTAILYSPEGVRLAVIRDNGSGVERHYEAGDRIGTDLEVVAVEPRSVQCVFKGKYARTLKFEPQTLDLGDRRKPGEAPGGAGQ
ncbi:MAG: tetratricopeptide repeat protein [Planctomycetes bacterium]|nr:tetratricopeptide repeat protein [Planctomycetota bacterium]